MRIAMVGAGFTPDEANKLRRSMATFKTSGPSASLQEKFIKGMAAAATIRSSPPLASSRSKVSANTAFPKATPRASPFLSMPRPGSNAITPTCSRPRCSTASRWAFMRPRRSCATRRSMASRCGRSTSICPTGIALWRTGPQPRGRLHSRHASMRDDIRTTHALRLGFRQINGFSEDDGKIIESVRGAASIPSAISGCARGCRLPRWKGSPTPTPSVRSASTAAMRCGRCGRCNAPATRTTCRCSRAWPCRSWSPTRICRRCCRASR